jgi:hypothetical protein
LHAGTAGGEAYQYVPEERSDDNSGLTIDGIVEEDAQIKLAATVEPFEGDGALHRIDAAGVEDLDPSRFESVIVEVSW